MTSHCHSPSSPAPPSFVLLLSLLTLALLQGCLSLYTHRPSFEPDPDLLLVQYNITILGGPSVAQVNVVSPLCANLQGNETVRGLGGISQVPPHGHGHG